DDRLDNLHTGQKVQVMVLERRFELGDTKVMVIGSIPDAHNESLNAGVDEGPVLIDDTADIEDTMELLDDENSSLESSDRESDKEEEDDQDDYDDFLEQSEGSGAGDDEEMEDNQNYEV
ncbi:hypothetical protein CEUSTIGMA_g12570.t1, partial [Chlamydomonas eustigma]